ncbi:WecB/TagA/CpsF family glycosyltransferase [Listeria fleischmannii]|uniref:N-acetylglucosaminyldiphosphoundecaprenol N-acetyl-beta-D-mannosaminyltransferase n=2 Tax=Listeria fleischmannii TaxID=1069827 RepID=A0A841YEB9_9LIST|nr:WecB/TagA/CpsF family glycosyltransferase [Listeria fleischmannii]MBC1398488.1 WecB/TagA/CpsF family glycosyltransferase [Listeria fleischmannii]MBC1418786.1 WecB/TagA/CpsF family glycosyltransferase [Listeria fleischmannii]MBC1426549.1 WecB/TagA/CpsF family glycosyltransferase [Listeria fleischmannii]
MMIKRVEILGIPFIHTTQDEFIARLLQDALDNKKRFVVTANPEIVMNARDDLDFKQVVLSADYITPDGVGILMAAKQQGNPLPERVTGFDTMQGILTQAVKHNLKIYFLGAKPDVNKAMQEKLKECFPALKIAGCRHGYFNLQESAEIVQEIKNTGADFVFVALGSPAQEKWIMSHFNTFEKGIFMGVGGSFDILSGTVKRAPKIILKLRIEWIYRFVTNPSRWRRFFAIPRFMKAVNRENRRNVK